MLDYLFFLHIFFNSTGSLQVLTMLPLSQLFPIQRKNSFICQNDIFKCWPEQRPSSLRKVMTFQYKTWSLVTFPKCRIAEGIRSHHWRPIYVRKDYKETLWVTYANTLDNIDEMEKYIGIHKLPKVMQKVIENLIQPIPNKEKIELIIKIFPLRKARALMVSVVKPAS